MAIFKKLSVGDTVATSGTRVFKKLLTEAPSLPIWNGTDLKDTVWVIQSGWTAEAGYGEFDVSCRTGGYAFNAGWGDPVYEQFCIGYYFSDAITSYATADRLCWRRMGMLTGFSDTAAEKPISFIGGTDTTNPRLIDWLLENATLTSHQLDIVGTWVFNDTITELPIFDDTREDVYDDKPQYPYNHARYIGLSVARTEYYPADRLVMMNHTLTGLGGDTVFLGSSIWDIFYYYESNTYYDKGYIWSETAYNELTFLEDSRFVNASGVYVGEKFLAWLRANARKKDSQ